MLINTNSDWEITNITQNCYYLSPMNDVQVIGIRVRQIPNIRLEMKRYCLRITKRFFSWREGNHGNQLCPLQNNNCALFFCYIRIATREYTHIFGIKGWRIKRQNSL